MLMYHFKEESTMTKEIRKELAEAKKLYQSKKYEEALFMRGFILRILKFSITGIRFFTAGHYIRYM